MTGAVVTLLLSAWAAAAGPVGVFAGQDFSGKEASAPGEEYGTTQVDNARGPGLPRAEAHVADDRLAAVFTFAMKAVLVAVVVLLLVAVARAVREALAERREAAAEPGAMGDLVPDVLLTAAREGEELIEHGTPANAVVAAWVRLEDAARSAGVRDDRARTAAELADVLRRFKVEEAALEELAGLYREARFSSHPIGEDMRDRARSALQRVTADLAKAVPPQPRHGASTGASR